MSDEVGQPDAPVTGKRDGRLALALIVIGLQMLGAYTFAVMPVFAQAVQTHFALTDGGLGFLLGCGTLGSLISLLLVGPATARFGARRLLQLCLVGVGLGMVCMGLGRELLVFEAGLIVAGFFGSAMGVTASVFLMALYPALRRRMLTISLMSISAPGIVFPILAQRMMSAARAGLVDFATILHTPFLIAGATLIALQFSLSLAARNGASSDTERREPFDARVLLSGPALLVILLATLHAASDNALWQWMPKFMESSFDELAIGTGTMLALVSVVYVLSRMGLAALPEGYGQRTFLVLPGLLGGSILLAVIWVGGPLAIALGYPLAAFMFSVEYPTLLSEVRASSAARFSTIFAAAVWISNLVTVLEVNLIGQIGERTGDLRIGLSVAAAGFVAFGLIALATGMGRGRQQLDEEHSRD
jgi:MFS family permease